MSRCSDLSVRERSPSPEERWGLRFTGSGSLEGAVKAIESASLDAGMVCSRHRIDAGTVRIDATQRAPWHRIVLHALPQRAVWRVTASTDRLGLVLDLRWFPWYGTIVLALAILLSALIAVTALTPDGSAWSPPAWHPMIGAMVLGAVVGVVYFLTGMIGGLGYGRPTEALPLAVIDLVGDAGGFLEIGRPAGVSPRCLGTLGLFFVWVLTLGAVVLGRWGLPIGTVQPVAIALLLSLVGMLAMLFAIIISMIRERGLIYRLTATAVSVGGMLAIVCALLVPLPWLTIRHSLVNFREVVTWNQSALRGEGLPADADPARVAELERRIRENHATFRRFGLFAISFDTGVLLFSFTLLLWTIANAYRAQTSLNRLSRLRARGVYRTAVGENRLLAAFRRVLMPLWVAFAVLVMLGLSCAAIAATAAVRSGSGQPWLDWPLASSDVVSFALQRPFDDLLVTAATRGGWALWGLTMVTLFAVSVGQLAVQRWRTRDRLRRSPADPGDPAQQRAQAILDRLAGADLADVRLAVTDHPRPAASSHAFGRRDTERYIEVTTGALHDFGCSQITAILAHELAHHRRHHCRSDARFRWLGRLTFVGDGFVRALQNSFGNELEADRVAVQELGAKPEALIASLEILNDSAGVWRRMDGWQPSSPIAPAGGSMANAAVPPTFRERWRRGWRFAAAQYFSAFSLHYWHPAYDERIAALRALSAE